VILGPVAERFWPIALMEGNSSELLYMLGWVEENVLAKDGEEFAVAEECRVKGVVQCKYSSTSMSTRKLNRSSRNRVIGLVSLQHNQ